MRNVHISRTPWVFAIDPGSRRVREYRLRKRPRSMYT